MKKLFVLFLSFVAMAITFTSCSENDNNNSNNAVPSTNLELTIKNDKTVVPNSIVVLYNSIADYQSNTNPVGPVLQTDTNGKVTFKNLEARVYFFKVSKADGCLDNSFSDYCTYEIVSSKPEPDYFGGLGISTPEDYVKKKTPIAAGKTTALDIYVIDMGKLTFTNNSTETYNVYLRYINTEYYMGGFHFLTAEDTQSVSVPAYGYDVKFVKVDPTTNIEVQGSDIVKSDNVVNACGNTTVTIL
jgi:hypothetical protein